MNNLSPDDKTYLEALHQMRSLKVECDELKRRLALAMWELCWLGVDNHASWKRERWVIPYRRAVLAARRELEKRTHHEA